MTRLLLSAATIALGVGLYSPAHAQVAPGGQAQMPQMQPASCTQIDIANAEQKLDQLPEAQRAEAQIIIQRARDAHRDDDRQRCAMYLAQFDQLAPGDRPVAPGAAAETAPGLPAIPGITGDTQDTAQAERAEPPLQGENIIAGLQQQNNLSTFAEAVRTAGLEETLREGGPYTIFAPTNAAFDRLPQNVRDDLMREENRDQLRTLLEQHVIEGRSIRSDQIPERLQPVSGQPILVSLDDGRPVLRVGQPGEDGAQDARQAIEEARQAVQQALQQTQDQQAEQRLRDAEQALNEAAQALPQDQQAQQQQPAQQPQPQQAQQPQPDQQQAQQELQQVQQSLDQARQALQDENPQQAEQALNQAQQPLERALDQAEGQRQQQLQQVQQSLDQARQALQDQNPQQAEQALDQAEQPLQMAQQQPPGEQQQAQQQPDQQEQQRPGQANVTVGDIRTGNGYIHGIDNVLVPDDLQDMVAQQ